MNKSIYILLGILLFCFLIGGVCGYFLHEKIHKCPVVVVKKDTVKVAVPIIETVGKKGNPDVKYEVRSSKVDETIHVSNPGVRSQNPVLVLPPLRVFDPEDLRLNTPSVHILPLHPTPRLRHGFEGQAEGENTAQIDTCYTMRDSTQNHVVEAMHCLPSNTWDVRATQPDIVFTDSTRTIIEKVIEFTGVPWLWVPVAIVFGIIAVAEAVTALTK